MKSDELLSKIIHESSPASPEHRKALEELIDRYRNLVRKRARAYFLIGGDPEDLIQEGMIGLYKGIMDFDESKGAFGSFISLCVERQILSAVKMASREKHQPLNQAVSYLQTQTDEDGNETQLLESIADPSMLSPEQTIVGQAGGMDIMDALKKRLSAMEFKVLELYLSGMGYQQIAVKLNITPKAADNALQRIRRKTIRLLEEMEQGEDR